MTLEKPWNVIVIILAIIGGLNLAIMFPGIAIILAIAAAAIAIIKAIRK